jgi:hypothetical protein
MTLEIQNDYTSVSAPALETSSNSIEKEQAVAEKSSSLGGNLTFLATTALNISCNNFFTKSGNTTSVESLGLGHHSLRKDSVASLKLTLSFLEAYSKEFSNSTILMLFAHEILAKKLPYSNLKEGESLRLPQQNSPGEEIRWIDYKVDEKLFLSKSIPVYGLLPCEPSQGSPYLIFKGSTFPTLNSLLSKGDTIATWRADFDTAGVGKRAFSKGKEAIKQWLIKANELTGSQADMIGHSLGGAFAQLGASSPELAPYVKRALVFNAPMVRGDVKEKYHEIDSTERPLIQGYSCRDDLLTKIGGEFLLGEHFEVSDYDSHLDHHSDPVFFASSRFALRKIDVDSVNKSSHVKLMGRVFKNGNAVISPVVNTIFNVLSVMKS